METTNTQQSQTLPNWHICAFGYCCEELYNRGCLPNWQDLWICDECKDTIQFGYLQKEKKQIKAHSAYSLKILLNPF